MPSSSGPQRLALTAAQEGVWIGQQLVPDSPLYNAAEYIRIDGPLNLVCFEKALRHTVTEAEALHIRFDADPRRVMQLVREPADWSLTVTDLSGRPDPFAAALAWMDNDLRTVTDLENGPLFGHALFVLGTDSFLWYHRAHHIVLDGYSFSLVASRVAELYTAAVTGIPCSSPGFGTLRTVVEDDVAYQNSLAHRDDREFWCTRFANRPNAVSLSKRTSVPGARLLRSSSQLPDDAVDTWRTWADRAGTTWAEIVFALVACYVHRSTGADEVVLGMPVMGRMRSAVARTPAMVMNVVPLRVCVGRRATVSHVARMIAGELRTIRPHQRYRVEHLRRDLQLVGGGQRLHGPMVNVMPFDYRLDFAGCRAMARNLSAGGQFVEDIAIQLHVRSSGESSMLDVDANPNCYEQAELAAHLDRLTELLTTGIPGNAHLEWVRRGNTTTTAYPREASLAELFDRRRYHAPHACAVIDADRRLSYAELDRYANAVAHALVDDGVTIGQRVGVAGGRCADAIIAIVGIIKAGAVYVPLDTAHPMPRLQAMAEDAQVSVLIALPGVDGVISGARVLRMDGRRMDHAPSLTRPVVGEDLAYVMFTSGTTGRPKAVGVRQRGITRLVCNTDYVTIGVDDRVLHTATLSFDSATFEIWGALLNGARLVIAPRGLQLSPDELRRELDTHDVSVVFLSTAVFHHLVGRRPDLFACVRDVVVGGDALNLRLARDVLASGPPKHLINAYGPTENTTFTTAYLVNDLLPGATRMPIGKPIANTTCYILRDDATVADIGEKGELVTGGDGVAVGYLNEPGLTAARFIPDPFTDDPSARLYRTGDIASWREDGTIDFHGRRDNQFKIRGHRVEADEIETTLRAHAGISEAVVIPHEAATPGDARLVAYLVQAAESAQPGATELEDYLRAQLPAHMIPATFMWLDHLPLTPHGKVDRTKLPAPPNLSPSPPLSTLDTPTLSAQIRTIWHTVLRARGVDHDLEPDDTLFAVGGTSLDVPLIHTRVVELLDPPDLTPLDLFTYPTLGGYTDHVTSLLRTRP